MPEGLYEKARFRVSGDRALIAEYGEGVDLVVNEKVRRMAEIVRKRALPGIETVVPSYRTLVVFYNPIIITDVALRKLLHELEVDSEHYPIAEPRVVEIPVCYGGELGPDIAFVAEHNHIGLEEVIACHSGQLYHIYAVGFAPGFCYLGGLDLKLKTPRLSSPRTFVPAGSVGIAESQTGVYPQDSPGGWRLIGRTPLKLFAPERPNPFLYQAGDKIRFKAITREEFDRLGRSETL
jgi:KipI family sensor histidine kinase inhibitor